MQQQVNLYSFLPVERKWHFTKEMLGICYAILFLLLIINYLFDLKHHHVLVRQAEQSAQAVANLQRHMAILVKKYPTINLADLTGSLKKLQDELNNQQQMQDALNINAKFSSYLLALSQAALPTIWLSEINFSKSEQTIRLRGHALQASALQTFINRLAHQSVFAQQEFKIEDLTEVVVDKNTIVDFVITGKARHPYEKTT